MARHRWSALALGALVFAACGEAESGDLREWRASDHAHPSADVPEGHPPMVPGADTAAPPADDADPAATEIRAATALFRAMCGSCHGNAGAGDGPGRPPAAQMADLSSDAWQSSRTDEEIAQVIMSGRGGFMPAFGDRLSPPGILALVRHIRRLGGRELTARPAPGLEPSAAHPAPGAEASPLPGP